jgi:hypothetical protein
MVTKRVPFGLRLLAVFFAFGAVMCALTIVLLLFPGTPLDAAWRLNPEAHHSFQTLGILSVLIMAIVGSSCAAASIGLIRGAPWGRTVALIVLAINLVGDAVNAVFRHDYRALIGIPVGGALIAYLCSTRIRKQP